LNEARNIFNEYCIIRRQRIVKALRSKNITFQEQDAGLSIAHHVMSSPSSGNQQQTEEAQAMDTTADSSCNNRQIVIGPLKILPPFGEV
jgi:hypothetical protein